MSETTARRSGRRYCYHVTNGSSRSALCCGTVTADSMEEAAEIAARRAGLVRVPVDEYPWARWQAPDGSRRSVYVMHDPR